MVSTCYLSSVIIIIIIIIIYFLYFLNVFLISILRETKIS